MVSPLPSGPLHHLNASQHTGPPLPHVAVPVEVVLAGQEVELDLAEHPVAVLDKRTEPGKKTRKQHTETKLKFFMTLLELGDGYINVSNQL